MASPSPSPVKTANHGPSASLSSISGYEPSVPERGASRNRARSQRPSRACTPVLQAADEAHAEIESGEPSESSSTSAVSTRPSSPSAHRSRTAKETRDEDDEGDGVEWLATVARQQVARDAGEIPGRLVPPLGFAIVSPGVYRSAPRPASYNFELTWTAGRAIPITATLRSSKGCI